MKILILAAGYAVRLQPLTTNTPKPLLSIGGKKMIDRILDKAASLKGADAIYIVSNHRFIENFREWLSKSAYRERTSLVDDGTITNETRLGAIRDMELAIKAKSIDDDLLIIAGDNLFELDLGKFIEFAKKHNDGVSVALYDVGSLDIVRGRYGVVSIDKTGRVVDFEEKPANPKSALASTGIYYFPRSHVPGVEKYIKSEGTKNDAPGYYIKWLSVNNKVYGFPFSEKWYDIGDIGSYEKADLEYKKREES